MEITGGADHDGVRCGDIQHGIDIRIERDPGKLVGVPDRADMLLVWINGGNQLEIGVELVQLTEQVADSGTHSDNSESLHSCSSREQLVSTVSARM